MPSSEGNGGKATITQISMEAPCSTTLVIPEIEDFGHSKMPYQGQNTE